MTTSSIPRNASGSPWPGSSRTALELVREADARTRRQRNNSYRVGTVLGSGTRPRIDDGQLGIAVLCAPRGGGSFRPTWRQWAAATFDVGADGPVAAGVDGERTGEPHSS